MVEALEIIAVERDYPRSSDQPPCQVRYGDKIVGRFSTHEEADAFKKAFAAGLEVDGVVERTAPPEETGRHVRAEMRKIAAALTEASDAAQARAITISDDERTRALRARADEIGREDIKALVDAVFKQEAELRRDAAAYALHRAAVRCRKVAARYS